MDKLKQCLNVFKSLMGKDYYLTLENGLVIKVYFAKKHFHHLMGLQKLSDIPPLVANKATNSTTTIYNNINIGRITYEQISKSAFFSKISDRIDNFSYMDTLIFEKIIIDFDKNKVPSAPYHVPLIEAKYILYSKHDDNYFHLCLGDDSDIYYPETFLVQPNDYYIVGQAELKVEKINTIEYRKKKLAPKTEIELKTETQLAPKTEIELKTETQLAPKTKIN